VEQGRGHAQMEISLAQGKGVFPQVPAGKHAGGGKADIQGVVEIVITYSAGFVARPASGIEIRHIIEQPGELGGDFSVFIPGDRQDEFDSLLAAGLIGRQLVFGGLGLLSCHMHAVS